MIFLHGQFGDPSDSSKIFQKDFNLYSPSLYQFQNQKPGSNLWDLAETLAADLKSKGFLNQGCIGYSYGGRLLLHAVLKHPKLFKWAVVVGAKPGIANPDLKSQRFDWDLNWGQKISRVRSETEWKELLNEWEGLEVFKDSKPREINLSKLAPFKTALSETFCFQGLGSQDYLVPQLHAIKIPILWVSGSFETELIEIYKNLRCQNPLFFQESIEGAGHRVPWDRPQEFCKTIYDFSVRQVQG